MDNRRRVIVAGAAIAITTFILLPLPHVKNGNVSNTVIVAAAQDQSTHSNTNSDAQSNAIVEHKNDTQVQYWDIPLSIDLQSYIRKLCIQFGVDEKMAYGVIAVESNFDPSKVSETGDYGLFQVNEINFPRLREKFGINNFLDPYSNSLAGIFMLSELKNKYNDDNEVLIGYNQGEDAMRQLVSRGTYYTRYVGKVDNAMANINVKGE